MISPRVGLGPADNHIPCSLLQEFLDGATSTAYPLHRRCLVDDSADLNPWLYTAMLTWGGELEMRGLRRGSRPLLVSTETDDLSHRTSIARTLGFASG